MHLVLQFCEAASGMDSHNLELILAALAVCDLSHRRSIVRDGNFVGER